mmetsp:Transcript_74335/g.201032  ORF Transcript_74335/g.201032 Transcript_74335/m.201032 type:complete len:227 (-) Transcript_74335:617-1297(-)
MFGRSMRTGSARPATESVEPSVSDFREMLIAPSTAVPAEPAGTAEAGMPAATTSALSTPRAANSEVGRLTSTPVAALTPGRERKPSTASLTLALVTVTSRPPTTTVMLDWFDAMAWRTAVSSAFATSSGVYATWSRELPVDVAVLVAASVAVAVAVLVVACAVADVCVVVVVVVVADVVEDVEDVADVVEVVEVVGVVVVTFSGTVAVEPPPHAQHMSVAVKSTSS